MVSIRVSQIVVCLLFLAGCAGDKVPAVNAESEGRAQAVEQIDLGILSPTLTYEERQGRFLFERYCGICHGAKGEADGFNTYNLNPKPHSLADSSYMAALSDDALFQVIRSGGRGVNKSILMPGYGWTLTKVQISHVVSYVRVLGRGEPTGN